MTDANGMNEGGPVQAEPFEETLEKFRQRVLHKGGTTEEHYALRKIAALAERLKACEEQLNIREIVTPIREGYIRSGVDADWAEVVGRLKADLARVMAERDCLRAALEVQAALTPDRKVKP